MNKLISASLAIALTSVSIGWAGNLESEAMEEETIMVAEETMATDFWDLIPVYGWLAPLSWRCWP